MSGVQQYESIDLQITFVFSRNEYSSIIKEIVEYAVDIVKEKYSLNIVFRKIVSDKQEFPLMIVNELEPVVFCEIPSLDDIVRILLASLRTISDRSSDLSNVNNSVLTSYF